MDALRVFQVTLDVSVSTASLIPNTILLIIIIRYTPNTMKVYSSLILVQCLFELISSLANLFTIVRLIPSGTAAVFLSNGPCVLVARISCLIAHTFSLFGFIFAMQMVAVSMCYRYYVLRHAVPSLTRLWLCVSVVPLVNSYYMVRFITDGEDEDVLYNALKKAHPSYQIEGATLTGFSSWQTFQGVNVISFFCVCTVVAVTTIFVMRLKILKFLSSTNRLTKQTKIAHQQLIQVLTMQSSLCLFCTYALVSYLLEQAEFIESPLIESTMFGVMHVQFVISPMVSIYFIRPYQRGFLSMLGRKEQVSEQPKSSPRATPISA